LAAEGFSGARAQIKRSAALHYKGQTYELGVSAPDGPVDKRFVSELEEAFGAEHERTYGHRAGPEEPVELVAIQVIGTGVREGSAVPERVELSRGEPERQWPRRAVLGWDYGWVETLVRA